MAKTAKSAQKHTVGVADFKARCLELLDGVGTRGDEIIITIGDAVIRIKKR